MKFCILFRFSIDLDLDAPKITIPAKAKKSDQDDTQLLLDLGHFTLYTTTVSTYRFASYCHNSDRTPA